jgi:protocatechuate 3,4-dioxygenase, alpha subunit
MTRAPASLVATPSQTVGPFFQVGLAATDALGSLVSPEVNGERMRLQLRVLDGNGAPVPDCLVEIYQPDGDGQYGRAPFSGFGRLATGADGSCAFETIRPGAVADGSGGMQAPHVSVCLFARGLLRQLYTRIYFAGDPDLDGDPVLSLVPAARRSLLQASTIAGQAGAPRIWEFVIRLQGEHETPFFDL